MHRDLKKYGPYALGAAVLAGGYYWLENRQAVGTMPGRGKAMVGGLDTLGAEEVEFVGKGGGSGHGGGGHGGHGGWRGRWSGGWGGGPYFWGPWYSDGYEVDDDWTVPSSPGPTAEEVAAELAKHLQKN
jgi:hypothetical protein